MFDKKFLNRIHSQKPKILSRISHLYNNRIVYTPEIKTEIISLHFVKILLISPCLKGQEILGIFTQHRSPFDYPYKVHPGSQFNPHNSHINKQTIASILADDVRMKFVVHIDFCIVH